MNHMFTCKYCQKKFSQIRKNAVFCSQKCHYTYRAENKLYSGQNNPFYGGKFTPEIIKKMSEDRIGKKLKPETIEKLKQSQRDGKSPFWKGGVSLVWWRKRVLERDNYKCLDCGVNDKEVLDAHHIKSPKIYPELKTSLDNGITVCKNCHHKRTLEDKELQQHIKDVHWNRKIK